jgi:hypothetical protein
LSLEGQGSRSELEGLRVQIQDSSLEGQGSRSEPEGSGFKLEPSSSKIQDFKVKAQTWSSELEELS